ncbi:unnamed protein product, partial [Laminaria digitata]
AAECLVGCLVQGISPFDDDNLAVWHDRSLCDSTTVGCEVNDVYEPPTVDQFDCEENALRDLSDSASVEECNWDGDVRMAQEMFSASAASSSTTATGVVVNTNTCLVGCLVQGISPFDEDNLIVWDNRGMCDSNTIGCQGISPFDEDNLVVWDNRGMCDSTTIGCQVNAVTYPG